ncbi:MAG: pilus assembly protein [Pirellulales bacterium]|nr:pilus assembly protein [Planctomycetales bacterium]
MEFALIAPVLFLLAFGIIEFGRMVMVQQVLTNASREGARMAILDGATTSEVYTAVDTYLDSAAVSSSGATRTVSPALPTSDDYVGAITVTVSVPFDQVSWLPSPLFLGGKTLTATSVMRRENTQ